MHALPGVLDHDVDREKSLATVILDDADAPSSKEIAQAISDAGYPATLIDTQPPAPAAHTLKLRVEGMTCGKCVSRVEKALNNLPGVLDHDVDREQSLATLTL